MTGSDVDTLPRVIVATVGTYDDDYNEDHDRWVAGGATDLTAGLVAVTVRSPRRRGHPHLAGVVTDVLLRLGHRRVADYDKYSTDLNLLVPYLLVAGVRDLVVQHAQWLFADGLADLFDLADLCGIRLWLFMHPKVHPDAQRMIDARVHPEGQVTGQQAVQMLEQRLQAASGAVDSPWPDDRSPSTWPTFPKVPRADVHHFVAVTESTLNGDDLELVNDQFLQVASEAAYVFRPTVEAGGQAAADGNDGRVIVGRAFAELLSKLLVECVDDVEHAIVCVRGLQHGLMRAGALAQVNITQFEPYALSGDAGEFTVTDWGWSRLRVYHEPSRPAIAALYVTGLIDPRQMQQVRICDVADDGSTVVSGGQELTVPEPARVYLRVARLVALVDGRGPDGLLLANPDDEPMATRTLQKALHEPRLQEQVRVVPPRRHQVDKSMSRWLKRRGITIRSLA